MCSQLVSSTRRRTVGENARKNAGKQDPTQNQIIHTYIYISSMDRHWKRVIDFASRHQLVLNGWNAERWCSELEKSVKTLDFARVRALRTLVADHTLRCWSKDKWCWNACLYDKPLEESAYIQCNSTNTIHEDTKSPNIVHINLSVDEKKHIIDSVRAQRCVRFSTAVDVLHSMQAATSSITLESKHAPHILVVNGYCLDVAVDLVTMSQTQCKVGDDINNPKIPQLPPPLVLNMASKSNPGGGWRRGAGAQEETLFRRTNYHLYLEQGVHGPEFAMDRQHAWSYPLPEFGGVYSPDVVVFRENEKRGYALRSDPTRVAMLACAAYRGPPIQVPRQKGRHRSKPGRKSKTTFGAATEPNYPASFMDKVCTKLRALFLMAHQFGHRRLVLSAFGCGAYGNPPYGMAQCFAKVLQEPLFKACFDVVAFAIIDDHNAQGNRKHNPSGNFAPFAHVMKESFGPMYHESIADYVNHAANNTPQVSPAVVAAPVTVPVAVPPLSIQQLFSQVHTSLKSISRSLAHHSTVVTQHLLSLVCGIRDALLVDFVAIEPNDWATLLQDLAEHVHPCFSQLRAFHLAINLESDFGADVMLCHASTLVSRLKNHVAEMAVAIDSKAQDTSTPIRLPTFVAVGSHLLEPTLVDPKTSPQQYQAIRERCCITSNAIERALASTSVGASAKVMLYGSRWPSTCLVNGWLLAYPVVYCLSGDTVPVPEPTSSTHDGVIVQVDTANCLTHVPLVVLSVHASFVDTCREAADHKQSKATLKKSTLFSCSIPRSQVFGCTSILPGTSTGEHEQWMQMWLKSQSNRAAIGSMTGIQTAVTVTATERTLHQVMV
jgi:uncharacterized protein (TIGR02452 family)